MWSWRLLPTMLVLVAASIPTSALGGSTEAMGPLSRAHSTGTAGLTIPWVGVNAWGLAAAADVYTCGGTDVPHRQYLDSTFAHLHANGVQVVRFWAFQSYATGPDGRRNWAALDRVFAAAESREIWLIPVLSNNWTDCDYWPVSEYPHGGRRKDTTDWYRSDYRVPYDGYPVGYTDWVSEAVARYRSRPNVVTWEVANEPQARSYAAADLQVFDAFLADATARIRAADPDTPASLGSIGTGQPGFNGTRFKDLLRRLPLGYATAHDYHYPDEPLPRGTGCHYHCLRSTILDARQADRPFYVGEAGVAGCDTYRSERLIKKMRAAFEAGASGYVFWAYRGDSPADACGYEFGPSSRLLAAVREWNTGRDSSRLVMASKLNAVTSCGSPLGRVRQPQAPTLGARPPAPRHLQSCLTRPSAKATPGVRLGSGPR